VPAPGDVPPGAAPAPGDAPVEPPPVLGALEPPLSVLVVSVLVELSAGGALGTAGAAGGTVVVVPLLLLPPPPLEAIAITTIRKNAAQPIATSRRRM
jgi:hypothetical protein